MTNKIMNFILSLKRFLKRFKCTSDHWIWQDMTENLTGQWVDENIHNKGWVSFFWDYLSLGSAAFWASLVAQVVKNSPAMQVTEVQFLGWKVTLEKG